MAKRKCIRNNWISEKTKTITFDDTTIGYFKDVQDLYKSEQDSILKTTPLTMSAVYPTNLQLQNVKHVINVFNDKVVAALTLQGKIGTANFIRQVLQMWKITNVKMKGEVERFNDPDRAVQLITSTNLQELMDLFSKSRSGYGGNRYQSITHDTKKALVQTMEGLQAVSKFLFETAKYQYVLLGQIQSDRIEREFSIYRQMNGSNAFMTVKDVSASFKKRLSTFSVKILDTLLCDDSPQPSHVCKEISFDEADGIEKVHQVSLTDQEYYAVAYVAGWIEMKTVGLTFSEEDLKIDRAKDFIMEVSRGALIVPHISTFELVKCGLCYMKSRRNQVCCKQQLFGIICAMNFYYDFGEFSDACLRRLANVLLSGLHKLEKDQEINAIMYQTSIKKARLSG